VGGITIDRPVGTVDYTDPTLATTKPYDYVAWTSPTHRIGFGATQLVAPWNDPASPSHPAVRHVCQRHQFETVWLRTERPLPNGHIGGGSGGVVYIITPHGMPLP
jgi:hypothetical protein